MSGHSRQFKRCHNPDCYCTGDCIGMTQSAPAVFTERGRNSQLPKVAWPERLNSAVAADPRHVTWHRPEHRSDSIEPDTALRESYMDGLRFGEGHRD